MSTKKHVIPQKGSENMNVPPFSRAVCYGSLVFVSGTVSQDLETHKPLLGTIEFETEQVIKNIEVILKAVGSSLDCVLKTQVFLTDVKNFQQMNAVYRKFFSQDPPARSTIGIQLAGDYKVEIEAIAFIPE